MDQHIGLSGSTYFNLCCPQHFNSLSSFDFAISAFCHHVNPEWRSVIVGVQESATALEGCTVETGCQDMYS